MDDEMGKVCNMLGGNEKCVQNFGWKAWREEKRTFRRPRWRWKVNIRMDLRKVGLEGVTQVRDW
jgi:hypothetical protein